MLATADASALLAPLSNTVTSYNAASIHFASCRSCAVTDPVHVETSLVHVLHDPSHHSSWDNSCCSVPIARGTRYTASALILHVMLLHTKDIATSLGLVCCTYIVLEVQSSCVH